MATNRHGLDQDSPVTAAVTGGGGGTRRWLALPGEPAISGNWARSLSPSFLPTPVAQYRVNGQEAWAWLSSTPKLCVPEGSGAAKGLQGEKPGVVVKDIPSGGNWRACLTSIC